MKNSGWKRAGCVLLAAQMTVNVLPMSSMAAYVDGQGRSGAILAAERSEAQRRLAARATFLLEKDRMPVMSKHRANVNSRSETALVASAEKEASTAVKAETATTQPADETTEDTYIEATAPDTAEPVTPTPDEGETTDTVVDPAPAETTAPGENETTTPTPGGEETTTPAPGEDETTEPTPDEGETTTPVPDGEETTEPAPDGDGTTTPVRGGEETTTPAPDEGETTTPAPDGEELPGLSTEELEQAGAMVNTLDLDEIMPLSEDSFEQLLVSVYAYNYWASREGSMHAMEGGGREARYAPYVAEFHNDLIFSLDKECAMSGDGDYVAINAFGEEILSEQLEALKDLELDRIPDMCFKGWIFEQAQPTEDPNWYSSSEELMWYSRYRAGADEVPYEPTFEALKAHANPYLSPGEADGYGLYETNVIAKWVPSDRADLTKLTLYGLSKDKATGEKKTLEQFEFDETDEAVKEENIVQVSALTEELTLDFTTYEPGTMIKIEADTLEKPILYCYDREDYIWSAGSDSGLIISADEYGAKNVDNDSVLEREQPGRRQSGGQGIESYATNSYDNPARANWSLPDEYAIPLNFTTPEKLYTEITITVVAPDGTMEEDGTTSGTTKTYTLKVRRMADPEMLLNPGNTPYGMMESDIKDPAARQSAKDDFDNSRTLPKQALGGHNGGGVYTGQYSEAAWKDGTDYDKSVEALVVYQDTTFTDPGFTLIDSQGETADNTTAHRAIQLRRTAMLTTETIQDGFGEAFYLNGGTDDETGKVLVVDAEGKDVIDLRGMNVVPGIYSIEYSYSDPVSGVTYNSVDKSVYMDETRADGFSRPLIVLPQPGDIDMDGMVTLADAMALEKFIAEGNELLDDDKNDQIQRLFKYRVCDVDKNGQVDGNDVVTLKNGYVSKTVENISTDYFYLNSGDNGKPERTPLVTETTTDTKAALSIEYLGNNLDGVPTGATTGDPVEIGNTFWVGVKLENADALPGADTGVEAFEFTLVYDPNVLQPGLLKGASGWQETIETANLSTSATTPWQDAYTLVGNSGAATPNGQNTVYVTYPELAKPTLSDNEATLATYTFALQRKADATARCLGDGYLLLVPFYMHSHPVGTENGDVALVEPAMGGREFSVTYVDGSVSAWSNQATIPGGHTRNLRDSLVYIGADKIPVGEDKTTVIPIYDIDGNNAVYGEPFSAHRDELMDPGYKKQGGDLPPGMDYDETTGNIHTLDDDLGALAAGTYRFYIGASLSSAKLYQITVDQAPLTLTVAGNSGKYYGEANPSGELVEFYYDNSQLKKQERDRLADAGLAANENKGSNLLTVLGDDSGYTRPTITMTDDKGDLLQPTTPAGNYTVRLAGGAATNYVFRYADKNGQAAEVATNTFQVAPRPIRVTEISDSGVTIPSNTPAANRGFDATAKMGQFVATRPTDTSGTYELTGDAILSGDELEIQYRGTFVADAAKGDNATEFVVEDAREERQVEITNAVLAGASVSNYSLRTDSPILTGAKTKGYVTRANLVKLTVEDLDALTESDYTYGDTFSLSKLGSITLEWDNGSKTGPFTYADPTTNPNANNHGVMLCWVDNRGDDPANGTAAVNNELFDVARHNGKYLCIYVSNGEGADPICVYAGPFKVNKKELTLTVYSEQRYYGEAEKTYRVTYDAAALVGDDRAFITPGGGNQVSDLDGLPGFRGTLKVERRETASVVGTPVTSKTNAGSYYVVISGAQADNYTIKYNQELSGGTAVSSTFGCAPLTILKRPILVTALIGSLGVIYDDDDDAAQTGELRYPTAGSQVSGVTIQRPADGTYYVPYGGSGASRLTIGAGDLTGTDAVLPDDILTFTYKIDYKKDNQNKPFFNVNSGDWDSNGAKTYEVTVSNLLLKSSTSDAGRNYQLVYPSAEEAMNGYPTNKTGEGQVVIRKITELRVGTAPTFGVYEYGQKLQAENMTVYAIFNGNTNAPQQISYHDFAAYGLHLEWTDKAGNVVTNGADMAAHGDVLTVVDHNGRKLVVRGSRHPEHEEVHVVFETPITVNKKTLHITAVGTERVYGQSNLGSAFYQEYQAVVAWDDLIEGDKAKLTAAGYDGTTKSVTVHSATLSGGSVSEGLALLDSTTTLPVFTTAAAQPKVNAGKYDLNLTGGAMENYVFALEAGTITVVPRPIMLQEVRKNPLATITQGSTQFRLSGVIASYSEGQAGFVLDTSGKYSVSGKPVLDGDDVVVSMTVSFGYRDNGLAYSAGDTSWMDLNNGAETRTANVKISDIKLVSGGENYELVFNPDMENKLFKGMGRVDGRQITDIRKGDSYAPKLSYTYGEGLDLSGVTVDIQYNTSSQATWERDVPVGNHQSVKVFYLANPALANTPEGRKQIVEGGLPADACRAAQGTDHLTIVRDDQGFAHNGKYLVAIVQQVNPNYDPADPSKGEHYTYNIAPIQIGQLTVAQKQLDYTLVANGREYDGTTKGTGYVLVDKDQIYGDDQVFIVNGTTYADMDAVRTETQSGRDYYRFDSGNTGVTFTFADPNVAYETLPNHDSGVYAPVRVGVSGIDITGADAGNYTVVRTVASTAANAPEAIITRSTKRSEPDGATLAALAGMAGRTTMSTDIHTNTVTVSVAADAAKDFGDSGDAYNRELHFEYMLEYLTNEGDLTTAMTVEGGDSRFFGGESVRVDSEEFTPAPGEENQLTPGMGQRPVTGDSDFGTRLALPRDTYFRAQIRLAQTHNYEASVYIPSVSDEAFVAAIAQARAEEESDNVSGGSGKAEETEPPRPIPDGQALGKTYEYRFDIVAVQTMKGEDGEEHVRSQLDSVWFADRATYPREEHLNALTTDPGAPRYHNYAWDPQQKQSVRFPLDLKNSPVVDLTQPDGSTQSGPAVQDGTAKLYVSLIPRSSGGVYYQVTILEGNLVAYLGDEPMQLTAQLTPSVDGGLSWSSSDTSVVTVDKNGVLTFVGEGVARIYASFAGVSDSIQVVVLPPKALLPEGLFNVEYLDAFMSLTDDLMFYPERTVSRGELAVILVKFLSPAILEQEGEGLEYVDIAENMDCAQAVELLTRWGIFNGVGEYHFAPEQIATRAEMATVLVRMGQLPEAPEDAPMFVDSGPEDTWAWAEIKALAYAGITDGTGDYCFSPDRLLTRAETAAFLTRMLRYKLDLTQEGLRYPIDVENDYWAWEEILRAVNTVESTDLLNTRQLKGINSRNTVQKYMQKAR